MASGCGGSGASTDLLQTIDSVVTSEFVAPIETTTTQVAVMPADIYAYTSGLGCVEYERNSTPARFTAEWGSCNFEGVAVSVFAFANQQGCDSFVEILLSGGGREEDIVLKGLVLFVPEQAAKIAPLRQALGM